MATSSTSQTELEPSTDHWPDEPQTQRLAKRPLTVLFYLCGDQQDMENAFKQNADDLRNLSLQNIWIAVQWDRYLGERTVAETQIPRERSPLTAQHESETVRFVAGDGKVHFERIMDPANTGDPELANQFVEWGINCCPSEQLALVMAGTGIGEPHSVVGNVDTESDYQRIFSFCDDVTGRDALSPIELGEILARIVSQRDNRPVNLLAFDMCSMQFLEIAYQFDGLVNVMIASQNNEAVPEWPYGQILRRWDEVLGSPEHPRSASPSGKEVPIENRSMSLAEAAVEIVGAVYALKENLPLQPMVSAVNLRHLEQVTRATDTVFVALLLSLGDDVVWKVRESVFDALKKQYGELIQRLNIEKYQPLQKRSLISYDIASLLATVEDEFRAYAPISHEPTQAAVLRIWCREQVKRLQEESASMTEEADLAKKEFVNKFIPWFRSLEERLEELSRSSERRRWNVVQDQKLRALEQELDRGFGRIKRAMDDYRERTDSSGKSAVVPQDGRCGVEYPVNQETVAWAKDMCDKYRDIEQHRFHASVENARHLCQLARRVLGLFQRSPDGRGFIIAHAPDYEIENQGDERNHRCGVSLYRPEVLDYLMHSQYLALDFHRRVHWAALLGAINLIDDHPRDMWRLISSLLGKSGGAAREELLRHLVGPESILPMGDQFRALRKPPTVTLSIAKQHSDTGGAPPKDTSPSTAAKIETYRLRYDSSRKGATVFQYDNPVNPETINNALARLEEVLKSGIGNPRDQATLDSLGRTLGEDIIQQLLVLLRQDLSELEANDVLHMQLQLPRRLMRYPWELMHADGRFLCEHFALGRQVFMESGLSRPPGDRKPDAIRALVIGDPIFDKDVRGNWHQLPGAREEAKEVANMFERLNDELRGTLEFSRDEDVLIQERVTTHQLRRIIRTGRYDIIHFAGHAHYDENNPECSAWVLSDGPLWALEIRNTLKSCDALPWLVYANACEAGMDSDAMPRYQSNVFGLATAFINEGVTAYVAPLWPISDAVALSMAVDFYSELLLERSTLGEALRYAKCAAKEATYNDPEAQIQALTSLSWASVILYGDPTMKLLDSFGTQAGSEQYASAGEPRRPGARERQQALRGRRRKASSLRSSRPLQASVQETQQLVAGPGMVPDRLTDKRTTSAIPANKWVLELAEVNGARYWQYMDRETGWPKQLNGSHVYRVVTENDRLRAHFGIERGLFDYPRIIGRWLIGRGEQGLITDLVEQYDKDSVATEQLLKVNADRTLEPLERVGLRWIDDIKRGSTCDRVLLIIHGTFSSTQSPVDSLGDNFIRWAFRHYGAVIGFDHHTLSVSPEANALKLWQLLDPTLKQQKNSIDIISHSRGGLVARALIELEQDWRKLDSARTGTGQERSPADVVQNVFFAGTPNAGTDLANPHHLGKAADMLVNLIHVDASGVFGKLSGLLARIAAAGAEELIRNIPGLWAQNPTAQEPQDFLGRLQGKGAPPKEVKYWAITTNYEPSAELNLKRVMSEIANYQLDQFFTGPNPQAGHNDLVVNTSHVWSVGNRIRMTELPSWWKPEQVLLFNSPKKPMPLPGNINEVYRSGVHHTNLLSIRETHEFLRNSLLMDADKSR